MIIFPVPMYGCVVTFDDDSMRGQVDTPGERGGGDEALDVLVGKQVLDECAVHPVHARVVDGEPIGQNVLQLQVLHLLGLLLQDLQARRALDQTSDRLLLQEHVTDGARRLARLLPAVHENQHLVLARILQHLCFY